MAQYRNIQVYFDIDTEPHNPGYVVSYDTTGDLGGVNLTEPLEAKTVEDAIQEAAMFLGVEASMIEAQS